MTLPMTTCTRPLPLPLLLLLRRHLRLQVAALRRILLPWPLRAAFGAQQAESSDQDAAGSGDYTNDGNAS